MTHEDMQSDLDLLHRELHAMQRNLETLYQVASRNDIQVFLVRKEHLQQRITQLQKEKTA